MIRWLLPLLIVFACPAAARADWTGLGGALNSDEQDENANPVGFAGVAGTPWITWQERDEPAEGYYQVLAARWDGSAWVRAGGPLNANPDANADSADTPVIADVGGVPYAAWDEADVDHQFTIHARVARWSGSAWTALGGQIDTDGGRVSSLTSIGGVPYVALSVGVPGNADIQVKRWTGTEWVQVGAGLRDNPYVSGGQATLADVGGVPHAIFSEDGAVRVLAFQGGAWTQLGGDLHHPGTTAGQMSAIAAVGGKPTAAWYESGAGNALELHVATFDGAAWVDLGGIVNMDTRYGIARPSLADVDGRVTLAWPEVGGGVHVAAWDGAAWLAIGGAIERDPMYHAETPVLANIAGVPHVGYVERYLDSSEGASSPQHYHVYGARLNPAGHVHFEAAASAVTEGNAAVLTVRRTGSTTGAATVHFVTKDGTASAQDYAGGSGEVRFADGESTKAVSIATTQDDAHEGDETFTVTLSGSVGDVGLDAPTTTTVTITDDDLIDTVISSGPDGYLTDLRFRFFVFSADPPTGATFACTLDDAAPAPCTNPFDPGASLAEGPHTFSVRASAGAATDQTPGTRSFFVDTIRPQTSAATYGTQLPNGSWSGPVQVRALATDSGSGVSETRCAVDPAEMPQTASSLPRTECPVTVTAPGTHTVYAGAVDKAGNAGIPASVTFRIAPSPDTTIAGGPSGPTWFAASTFTFASSVPGSTFICRVDEASFKACSAIYLTAELPPGTHSIEAAAISSEGVTDPTPASRTFSIRARESVSFSCGRAPFPSKDLGAVRSAGCMVGACPARGIGKTYCQLEEDPDQPWQHLALFCPTGAYCSVTNRLRWTDDDADADWSMAANAYLQDEDSLSGGGTKFCETGYAADRCAATASVSGLGDASGVGLECSAFVEKYFAPKPSPGAPRYGNDDERDLECDGTLTIEAAKFLQIVVGPRSASVLAPAAGDLAITPSNGASGRAAVTASRRRPFKAIVRHVTKPGPVTMKLALSRASKRTIRRRGKLATRIEIAFTPTGGARTTRTTRIVVHAAPKPVRKCTKRRPLRHCLRG